MASNWFKNAQGELRRDRSDGQDTMELTNERAWLEVRIVDTITVTKVARSGKCG
jgi:hypothetical protein